MHAYNTSPFSIPHRDLAAADATSFIHIMCERCSGCRRHNDTQYHIILLYYYIARHRRPIHKSRGGGVHTRARSTAVFSSRFFLRIYRRRCRLRATAVATAAATRISFDRFLFFPPHNSII